MESSFYSKKKKRNKVKKIDNREKNRYIIKGRKEGGKVGRHASREENRKEH